VWVTIISSVVSTEEQRLEGRLYTIVEATDGGGVSMAGWLLDS